MSNSNDLIVHLAEKDSALPEVGKANQCCANPQLEMGYGLAGGGVGVYEYCVNCEKIVSKTQETDE